MNRFFFLLYLVVSIVLSSASDNLHAQWVNTNAPYSDQVSCLAVIGSNLFEGTRDYGVFLSTNNGISWTEVNNGLPARSINTFTVSGINLFAGTAGNGSAARLYISTNNGTSWKTIDAVPSGYLGWWVYHSIAVSGTNIFVGKGAYSIPHVGESGGLFHSTDNGASWTYISSTSGLPWGPIKTVAVSGTNLFAFNTEWWGLYRSTNNGSSWTVVNSELIFGFVTPFAESGPNLFIGGYGGVFISTNNGIDWTACNSGLTNLQVRSFAVSGSNLFAGTYGGGVYLTTNNGTSWTAINSGLTNPNVVSLAVSDTYLFAGTVNGVWRRPLSEIQTSAEEHSFNVPLKFELSQNYPNPFNPSTTIEYQIKEEGLVQLKVFNLLGQEVALLVNEIKSPGQYSFTFDAGNLTSGVYIYSLRVNDFVQNNRMTLLK